MHSRYWIMNQTEPILVDNFSMMPSFQKNFVVVVVVVVLLLLLLYYYCYHFYYYYCYCSSVLFKLYYYSFKIFPRFWFAKSTRIIRHNQLLMTKFGRILRLMNWWRQKCSLLAGKCTVNREDLGTRLSCFGCENKNGGHFTRFKSKN